MAVEDDIQFERDGHIARVWFNRPHKRNCITVPMLHRLDEIITEIEGDDEIRAVVVRGRGNTFSSGFDLDSLQSDFIGSSTAMDVAVLSEAARSLGASWWTVTWRVLLPNLRRGITAACFLTITVVLGEYTLASFLSRTTFQTALLLVQSTDPYVAAVFSLAALLFGFVLLVLIGRVGTGRRRTPKESA